MNSCRLCCLALIFAIEILQGSRAVYADSGSDLPSETPPVYSTLGTIPTSTGPTRAFIPIDRSISEEKKSPPQGPLRKLDRSQNVYSREKSPFFQKSKKKAESLCKDYSARTSKPCDPNELLGLDGTSSGK